MKIRVSSIVYPTESLEKVKSAILSVFPGISLAVDGNIIVGESSDPHVLEKFREALESRRIRSTFEAVLMANWKDGKTWVDLNKQDATTGMVNVAEENPLGPIHVEFFGSKDEIRHMIWRDRDGDRS